MITACITARNEGNTIADLVHELKSVVDKIIVIDNASTDWTADTAERHGAQVYRHDKPLGIGPALLKAWRLAINQGAQKIVQIDAGGSHDPSQARRMLVTLDYADIVIGSRYMVGSVYHGRPLRNRISRLIAEYCTAATGVYFSDWTSGYRAFRREAIKELLLHDYRAIMHAWQIEVLRKAISYHMAIAQVPIKYVAGKSAADWHVLKEAFWVLATINRV